MYEYVKEIPPAGAYDPDNPTTRYRGIVPMLFDASFTLPNYKGDVRGITNDAGRSLVRWSAGQALLDLVVKGPGNNNTGTQTCGDNGVANSGQCSFPTLTAKIQRHIFTTSRNGVFPTTITNYFDTAWLRGAGNRAILWPPVPAVDPVVGTVGAFDSAWAHHAGADDVRRASERVRRVQRDPLAGELRRGGGDAAQSSHQGSPPDDPCVHGRGRDNPRQHRQP